MLKIAGKVCLNEEDIPEGMTATSNCELKNQQDEMMAQECSSPGLFATAFQKFQDLRQIEKGCDICLVVENNKIHAHKLVLAYVCPYFENLFFGPFSESGKKDIELKEIKLETLSILIDYMYTGKITINSKNIYDIYEIADRFEIQFVKEFCAQFLEENLNMNNCIKIWLLANTYISERLQSAAKTVIALNLNIVSHQTEFFNLSESEITEILSLYSVSELADIFIDAAISWAQFDEKNRTDFLRSFLKTVPSNFISEEYLDKSLSRNKFLQDCLSCNQTLLKIYREKSIDQKENFNASILIMTDDRSHQKTTFCCYNLVKNIYLYGKDRPPIYCYDGTIYKDSLYIFGMSCCYSYDRYKNWVHRFNHDNGKNLRAVSLNDSIFMIAGENNPTGVTKYDINTGQSEKFVLQKSHLGSGATIIDGSIYICGGYNTDVIERFDPREPTSKLIGSISNPKTFTPFFSSTTKKAFEIPSYINNIPLQPTSSVFESPIKSPGPSFAFPGVKAQSSLGNEGKNISATFATSILDTPNNNIKLDVSGLQKISPGPSFAFPGVKAQSSLGNEGKNISATFATSILDTPNNNIKLDVSGLQKISHELSFGSLKNEAPYLLAPTSVTSLSNTIYCSHKNTISKLDIRYSNQWGNSTNVQNMTGPLCTSHGKIIYGSAINGTIYEIDKLNLFKTELITVPNILHQMIAYE